MEADSEQRHASPTPAVWQRRRLESAEFSALSSPPCCRHRPERAPTAHNPVTGHRSPVTGHRSPVTGDRWSV